VKPENGPLCPTSQDGTQDLAIDRLGTRDFSEICDNFKDRNAHITPCPFAATAACSPKRDGSVGSLDDDAGFPECRQQRGKVSRASQIERQHPTEEHGEHALFQAFVQCLMME